MKIALNFLLSRLPLIMGFHIFISINHYNGSFSRMACDYIHATGMKEEGVDTLLEAMRDMTKCNE